MTSAPVWSACSTLAAHREAKRVSSGRLEYRSYHSGAATAASQSPAVSASWFSAALSVSTTNSSRFRSLVAAST